MPELVSADSCQAPGSPIIEEPVVIVRGPEKTKHSPPHKADNVHSAMLETPSWSFAGLASSPTDEEREPTVAAHRAQVSEPSESLRGQPTTQPGDQKQAGRSFGHRRERGNESKAGQPETSAGQETVRRIGKSQEYAKAAPPSISTTSYEASGGYMDVSPITPESGTPNDKITAGRKTRRSPAASQSGPQLTDISPVSPENFLVSRGQHLPNRPELGRHDSLQRPDEIISRSPRRQQRHDGVTDGVIPSSEKSKQRSKLRAATTEAVPHEEQVKNALRGGGQESHPATPNVHLRRDSGYGHYPPAKRTDPSKQSLLDTGGPVSNAYAGSSAWFAVKTSPFWTFAAVACTALYILGASQFFALAQLIGSSAPSLGAVRREVEGTADLTQSALTWVTAKTPWLDSMSIFALLNMWHLLWILFIMIIIQVMQANMEVSSKSDGTTSKTIKHRLKAGPAAAWAHVKKFGTIAQFQGVAVAAQGLCVLASIATFAACLLYLDFLVNRLATLSPSMMDAQQSGNATVILVNIVFLVFVPILLLEFVLCLQACLRWYRIKLRDNAIGGDGKPSGARRRLSCLYPC